MVIGWSLSGILTSTGYFSDDPKSPQYKARADYGINTISKTPWFYFPYPGKSIPMYALLEKDNL